MSINVRSSTLKKYLDENNFRLSKADREFLHDLTKVKIIDEFDAKAFHYNERKTASTKRLDKLCKMGLLDSHSVNQPSKGTFKAYTFKTDKIAKLFGGSIPTIGRKRNALHEVICSKIYFAENRPETWTTESDFSKDQKSLFKVANKTMAGRDSCIPDALYIDKEGEIVVIEADSGQYNKSQIINKQAAWTDFKQVWGQPSKASAVVDNAKVYRF
jgi:hypothetical protein